MMTERWIALGFIVGFSASGWAYALYWRREAAKLIRQFDRLLDDRLAERRRLTGKP